MFAKILLISLVHVSVLCEHKKIDSRRARLFSFNTLDDDIAVSLEFSIPFLTVPVKKTMDSAFGLSSLDLPSININPSALALGGAIVLGSTIVIPFILKSLAQHYPQQRYSKLLSNADFEVDNMLEFINEMMENRNFHGCALRVACWSGQSSYYVNFMKIWDQVTSNNIISTMINTTAVQDAMIRGRKGFDCLSYTPCPLQKNHLPGILKNIALLTKNHLF